MRTHNNEINSVLLGIVDDLVDWGTEPNVRFKFECGPFFRRQDLVQLLTALLLQFYTKVATCQPGFPIWLWYLTARTSRRAVISGVPTQEEPTTEGDTLWVNYSTRRFSSRSMAF